MLRRGPGSGSPALKRHLARCESCSGFAAFLRRLEGEAAPPAIDPPEDLVRVTLRRIEPLLKTPATRDAVRRPSVPRWAWSAALALLVAAALGTRWWIGRDRLTAASVPWNDEILLEEILAEIETELIVSDLLRDEDAGGSSDKEETDRAALAGVRVEESEIDLLEKAFDEITG